MRPDDTVDYHIKSSWLNISRMYNQLASGYDLTQATGYVLLTIEPTTGLHVTKIGPLMGMEATGMSRLLKSMETEGLIYREKDHFDGRKVIIHLTEKGMVKRKLVRKVVRRFNERILEEIGEKEFDFFKGIINKVNQVADEYKKQSIDQL
ncbi:MAG: MarR family transcriptional regulator [Vicingaceae bacterium]